MQSADEVEVGTAGLAPVATDALQVTPQEVVIRVLEKGNFIRSEVPFFVVAKGPGKGQALLDR